VIECSDYSSTAVIAAGGIVGQNCCWAKLKPGNNMRSGVGAGLPSDWAAATLSGLLRPSF
jgi:beta-lactamase class A